MRRFSRVTIPAVLMAAGFSVSSLPPAMAAMERLLPSGDGLRPPASAGERLEDSARTTAPILTPPAPAAEIPNETASAAPAAPQAEAGPERARIALKPQIRGASEEAAAEGSRAVAQALGSVYSLTLSLVDGGELNKPEEKAPVVLKTPASMAKPAFRLAGGDALRVPGKEPAPRAQAAPAAIAKAPPAKTKPDPATNIAQKAEAPETGLPSLEPQAPTPVESAALVPAKPLPQPAAEEAEEMIVAEAAAIQDPQPEPAEPATDTGAAPEESAAAEIVEAAETGMPEPVSAETPAKEDAPADMIAVAEAARVETAPVKTAVIEGAPSAPIQAAAEESPLPAQMKFISAALMGPDAVNETDKRLAADLPPPPDPALEPAAVYAGNFSGDGHADRLVFWRDAESKAPFAARAPSVYASDGQGALQPRRFFAADGFPQQPSHVRVADFNGDGRDDVFIASGKAGGETLQLWLSGEDGLLHNATEKALPDHEPWQSPRWQVWAVALGDVDANGHMDILIGTQPLLVDFMEEQSVVRLFVNDGTGLFYDASDALPARLRDPALLASAPERLAHISLKDMNDDEADDLLAYLPEDNKHVVFLNAGFGDFTRSDALPARYFAKRDRPGKTGAIASLAGQNPFMKK